MISEKEYKWIEEALKVIVNDFDIKEREEIIKLLKKLQNRKRVQKNAENESTGE